MYTRILHLCKNLTFKQESYIYTIVTFAIEKYQSRLMSVVIAANDEMVAQVSIVSGDVSMFSLCTSFFLQLLGNCKLLLGLIQKSPISTFHKCKLKDCGITS